MDFFSDFKDYQDFFVEGVILPKAEIPNSYKISHNLSDETSSEEFLRCLINEGLQEKKISKNKNSKDYYERIEKEIEVLDKCGFIDYVILNWEIVSFCKENKIPTGKGRGSAAGCLILYLIGVTRIDPIKHHLIFERFVSMARADKKVGKDGKEYLRGSLLADVDLDISYSDRDKVANFISEKFSGNTCKILTVNTLSGKLCIKECMKIIGNYSEDDTKKISDLIPKRFGIVAPLSEAYEEVKEFKEFCDSNRKIYEIALKLENLNTNTGVHPSGIAISAFPLDKIMPVQKTKDGSLVSGFEMGGVAEMMVKFDILGLRTLTLIKKVCEMIGEDYTKLNYEDPFIYERINEGLLPIGLFQIEAPTNYSCAKSVKPKDINEFSDVIALARPGAVAFIKEYVDVKNGKDVEDRGNKNLNAILKDTKGIVLYQETIMSIANKIFKFSLDETETLRKVLAKKKVDEIPLWEEKIRKHGEDNGISKIAIDYFWRICVDSAKYSFNLSHSVCYSATSAETVLLKYKYPKEFFCCLLQLSKDEPDPFAEIQKISQELPHFGIKLLPPDLAKSKLDFSIEKDHIRYGLGSVKGVSDKTLEKVISFRKDESNDICDIYIAAKRAGLSIGVICSFVHAGLFDSISNGQKRCRLVYTFQTINSLTEKQKSLVFALFKNGIGGWDILETIKYAVESQVLNDEGKLVFKNTTMESLKEKCHKYRKVFENNVRHSDCADWFFEKKVLGYSFSKNIVDIFDNSKTCINTMDFANLENNAFVKMIGWASDDFKSSISKNKNKNWSFSLNDDKGCVSCRLMDMPMNNRSYSKDKREKPISNPLIDYINSGGQEPEKDDIIIITGTKANDTIFIKTMEIKNREIVSKFSEIDDEKGSAREGANQTDISS